MNEYIVLVDHDEVTKRFFVRATNVPGLTIEADSLDEMKRLITHWTPILVAKVARLSDYIEELEDEINVLVRAPWRMTWSR